MSKTIRDLKICNNACVDEAVRVCKEPRKMVQEVIAHLFSFTATNVQGHLADSVQLPYFGKFKAKQFKSKFKKHAKPI